MSKWKGSGLAGLAKMGVQDLAESMAEGEVFQDILGWSDKQMEELLDCLRELNTQSRWEDAIDGANMLILANPYFGPAYTEAGFACQNLNRLEEAASLYAMGGMHTFGDVRPYLYLFACNRALGNRDAAIEALKLAIATAEIPELIDRWGPMIDDLHNTLKIVQGETT